MEQKWYKAIKEARLKYNFVPQSTFDMAEQTLDLAENGTVCEKAAAFFFGREAPAASMFKQILEAAERNSVDSPYFMLYLKRHIQLDQDEHAPIGVKIIELLCQSPEEFEQAYHSVKEESEKVVRLWDGIYSKIQ